MGGLCSIGVSVEQPADESNTKAFPRYEVGQLRQRPWGLWEVLAVTEHSCTKALTISPGGVLKPHRHQHRYEIWTIVEGWCFVTVGGPETAQRYNAGDHLRIPVGSFHGIENVSEAPCTLLEVQYGAIVSEDDIERKGS